MYARRVDDRELVFSVSGLLWNDGLIMLDRPSKSLWSQLLGRAMEGTLKDKKLKVFSSIVTDWKTWQTMHPETTVAMLKRTTNDYDTEFYKNRKEFVLGALLDGVGRAWAFDQLVHQPVANEKLQGKSLLVFFDEKSNSAFLYDRKVDDRVLTFEFQDDILRDVETGTRWDGISGRVVEGRLNGKQLNRLPATISYRWAWEAFYPESTWFRVH